MTKNETIELIKKIKVYYPIFKIDEFGLEEWSKQLQNYDLADVVNKFEEHLKGSKSDEPPKLHFITKYLRTTEEKERMRNVEYTIQCNLCKRYMTPLEYEEHYDKCLAIQTLLMIYKDKGDNITREMLEQYNLNRLESLLDNHLPKINSLQEVVRNVG